MAGIMMVARSVGTGGGRTVVRLEAVPDPNSDVEAGGNATLIINDPDEQDTFEEGEVYEVTFGPGSAPKGSPILAQQAAAKAAAEAAAIPNASNTAGYVVPPEQKVAPPQVPDGVVTLPRPSVVMEPLPDTAPPTAGTTSAPAENPTPASQPASGTTNTGTTTATRKT